MVQAMRRWSGACWFGLVVAAAAWSGCQSDASAPTPVGPSAEELGVGEIGMRRLTAHELDNVLVDLLDDDTRPSAAVLPEDLRTPYDNAWVDQDPSQILIEGLESLARDTAQALVADAPRRDAVVGCMPNDVADTACLQTFVERFGRVAWRRPLTSAEVDDLVTLGAGMAEQTNDFYAGIEVVVRAMLQSPYLVYRLELGQPVAGQPALFELDGYEVATRLAFLIWGSTPNDALLDMAASGELDALAARRDAAVTMLDDPRARLQLDRFHAMWMGYETLPHEPAITSRMRQESAALLDRVIFDEPQSWLTLFSSTESYIDDTLAAHYGLPAVGSAEATWVDVSGAGRKGILSHGSFLSAAANPIDTSPTKRGKLIRERLMCSPVPPPPPDVPADDPPDQALGNCKIDQYAAHREDAGCAACHKLMDDIGFGLENYDRAGRYREHDDGKPECVIAGQGEVFGVGTFQGPAELSDLLLAEGLVDACAVKQLFQYAMGRDLAPSDDAYVGKLVEQFAASDHRFDQLIVDLVSHEAFGYRLSPPVATTTEEEGN
jgi:Protein of unknown function (DUF1588)/Protein of unknown function (DUF1592)/Protein of unknown function (DUF1595)/Protein of unknown function (DUF1585)